MLLWKYNGANKGFRTQIIYLKYIYIYI